MKKFLVIATVTIATLGATSAIASSSIGNKMDFQGLRDSGMRNSNAADAVLKAARGVYDMEDGTTLSLYKVGSKFVAEVSGKEPFEIIATNSGIFVAVNGSAQLRFVRDGSGRVASVVLTKG